MGERFGRLLVVAFGERRGRQLLWDCICDCGRATRSYACNLRSGKSTSCGCLTIERTKETRTTHGQRHAPEYSNWCLMRRRCFDERCPGYEQYGARGITVSVRWLGPEGFANFLADLGRKPTPGHSLDRYPNQAGNYEPGNVRWATSKEQSLNSSMPRLYTIDGVTDSVRGWARLHGRNYGTVMSRLRAGWPIERALSVDAAVYKNRPRLWDAHRRAS